MVSYDLFLFMLKTETSIRGTDSMPFLNFHLRSTSRIICVSGSFAVRESFAVRDHLRRCTTVYCTLWSKVIFSSSACCCSSYNLFLRYICFVPIKIKQKREKRLSHGVSLSRLFVLSAKDTDRTDSTALRWKCEPALVTGPCFAFVVMVTPVTVIVVDIVVDIVVTARDTETVFQMADREKASFATWAEGHFMTNFSPSWNLVVSLDEFQPGMKYWPEDRSQLRVEIVSETQIMKMVATLLSQFSHLFLALNFQLFGTVIAYKMMQRRWNLSLVTYTSARESYLYI